MLTLGTEAWLNCNRGQCNEHTLTVCYSLDFGSYHIGHGGNEFLSSRFKDFVESGQGNIVGPLDDFVVLNNLGTQRNVSLSQGIQKA